MKKVLILDDEQDLLDLWFAYFKIWNISAEIHTAKNGVDGLRLVEAVDDYDLIITDYKMPRIDGIEFVRKVKHINNRKNIPIFFFTAYTPEVVSKYEDLDQVMVFEKPIITDKILLYIKMSLKLESHK